MRSADLRALPLRARVLILLVVAGGTAAVAVRIPDVAVWSWRDVVACVILAAGVVVTELMPIRLRYRTETLNFSLTEALWIGLLIHARPGVLTISLACGLLVAQLIGRRPAFKVGFNVGQFLIAVGLALVVYERFHPTTLQQPRAWVAATAAMLVYAAVNATLVAGVISMVERRSFPSVVMPPLGVNALHFAGNTALGLGGAVIWMTSPLLLPAFVLPLVLAVLAYRVLIRNVREGERVRELIVEYASDGIFMLGSDGSVLSWNPAMERITGYPATEAIGQPLAKLFASPEEPSRVSAEEPGAAADAPSGSVSIVRKDGADAWLECSSSSITQGRIRASVVVVHDVTATRRAEQLKSDFVATITHELRTPLTPLKGFLATLLQGTVADTQEARDEYYRIMLKQTDRLERLINDLLEVSRIESERQVVSLHPTELASPVADQVRSFAERYPSAVIRFRVNDRPVIVSADPQALGLVVSNLLSNAIKYSGADLPIDVDLIVRGEEAVVSVADRGEGIPQAEQERIFERFYQVENHMTRRSGGTGLGLYISRRLVEAMGGRIWVESGPEPGSVFSFSLPLASASPGGSPIPTRASGRSLVSVA
jgi:PAS domain S-box-containing protein